MRSIERYLLSWIMGALVLGSILIALVTYAVTLEEMNEVFDADLKNLAQGVASSHREHRELAPSPAAALAEPARVSEETEIATFAWDESGALIYASDPQIAMPRSTQEGLSHANINGEAWIVYTSVLEGRSAQAAQRVSSRSQMAGESATRVIPPMLALAVGVGGLLIFGLRRGLRPLDGAARDVAERSVKSLDPIPVDDVPREIVPLVGSINDLMLRLSEAFSHQRRFMADAAHELRTPVTALKLQLQLLARSPDEASRALAMHELQMGVARAQRLIEQLLQVARSEPEAPVAAMKPIDLALVVRHVVETLSVKADDWLIDLGADLEPAPRILGDSEQLTVLLNNLVENALRFTPAGGIVDVAVRDVGAHVELVVSDTGCGIPPAQRARVFDRFFRGENSAVPGRLAQGSGLGLAIVKAIADRHAATVSLGDRSDAGGLRVIVRFPSLE